VAVRIVAVADQHGQLPPIPPCDLLLIAGDVCPLGDHSRREQLEFLEGPFAEWLVMSEADEVVGVAGNHDLLAEDDPAFVAGLPWTYLCDSEATVCGLRIWGTPRTPTFGDWAFMEPDAQLGRYFDAIPDGLDVLLSHGPPFGVLDLASRGELTGSETLRRALLRAHPQVCVFGHIHEGHGEGVVAGVRCINAAIVDRDYLPAHRPFAFQLDPRVQPV
jgi:Icc-related predicted phosphoesterase